MTFASRVLATASPWGTFDTVREHLYKQFRNVQFDPDTGLPLEELTRKVDEYLSANGKQPRVLQKANVYRIVLTEAQILVDPADWYVDKLNHGRLVSRLFDRWYDEAAKGPLREEYDWFEHVFKLGVMRGLLDIHHFAPGWENMFKAGLSGLIEKAEKSRRDLAPNASPSQIAFLEAVRIVYEATIILAGRYADLAESLIFRNPDQATRLAGIASACRNIPAGRPRTLHEALQFIWLLQCLIEVEAEWTMSMGHFDRMLYPYYKADVDAGRLTPEQAKELVKFFFFKFHARMQGQNDSTKNVTLGGQNPDGSDATNEFTFIALDARREINATDPKMSVRFFPGSPERLYRQTADMIRSGSNSFVLINDVPAVEALVRRGKPIEDARSYLSIGCYEPAVDCKEIACTMNLTFNLAKGVELALNDGIDPLSGDKIGPNTGDPRTFESFEELYSAYIAQIDYVIDRSMECLRAHERRWPTINPSPLLAGSIDDCIVRAKDAGEGGARYNSTGCVGSCLANACDSLIALKKAVFDEKRYTMDEILAALKRNFEGFEPMRQYLLNRAPKWGNNDPVVDELGKRIGEYFCDRIHTLKNSRGGGCQAALFSLTFRRIFGEATGALPDGRKARESMAPGVGAMTGCDKNGVTALMNSALTLDFTKTPNGSVLDLMLHPTAVRGEEGLNAFVALIKTFFAKGGYALQFNVVDPEMLRDAQRHPERYSNLQIRVTGWSVYFSALSKAEQDHFIARSTHGL